MTEQHSKMRREILEIPQVVERLLQEGAAPARQAAEAIKAAGPRFGVTVARGSSDHVCTYLKYVSELLLGLPVASLGPSVASIYHAPLRLADSFCLSVSQSGQSPDIVAMGRAASEGGAMTVALTNDIASPLAAVSAHTLDIHAGLEQSVAATKTFVASAVAGLRLLAEVSGDRDLLKALSRLPADLEKAAQLDWPDMRAALTTQTSLFTLGRGPSWAMANEAALKFKETCQLHAESYSSAEVLHGPVSIVGAGFPVLAMAAGDAAEEGLADVADQLAAKGAQVFVTSSRARAAAPLEFVRTAHPLADPISLIVSFYAMVERLARARGIDPDTPRHLRKVTQTT